MNLRNVLRAYAHLRQLTDDESAFLTVLQAMSETERDLLVESLSPVKVAKRATARKSASKSPRASGMAAAIGKSLAQQRVSFTPACEKCDYNSDHNIHHLESTVGYHPFQPATTAPAARNQSSASNGEAVLKQNEQGEVIIEGAGA